MRQTPIYLDHNATTPCDPRVVEAMLPYFTDRFGNPASVDHPYGWAARDAVEEAREQVATLIGAHANQVIFTSGATESIHLALDGIARAQAAKGNHIITCQTEHRAVLDACARLAQAGYRITHLGVDGQGRIDLEALEAAIDDRTVCLALMHANNETGTLHPVRQIGAMARRYGIPFFCDATQAVGKIPVDVAADAIDALACSAHKIHGPKGIGALFVRYGISLPQPYGNGHEGGMTGGTPNTPGIVGFGRAAALCTAGLANEARRIAQLRDGLEQALLARIPGTRVNGSEGRLPHVSNLLLPHGNAEQLLLSLSARLALSRGSACSGLVQRPSHVLKAMGLDDASAHRAIRISLGRFTTATEVEQAAEWLAEAVTTTETVD